MIRIIFVVYALVLLILTIYTNQHRRDFMGLTISEKHQQELAHFSVVFAISTLLAVAAAVWPQMWLQLAALLVGALAAGLLGLRVAKYAGEA